MAKAQLTDREKLALSFAAFTGCDDWRYIYHMSLQRPHKTPAKDASGVSRWKHSPRVSEYFKDQQAAAAARIVEHKKKAINDFIENLPEYIRKAIRENRDITPEEFALPPRLQDIGQAMTREEFENPARVSLSAKRGKPSDIGSRRTDKGQAQNSGADCNTHEGGESDPAKLKIDFRNRDEALNYYNELANTTGDERIRMECIARISELERFKAEVSQKNDITRAYLPLRCGDCPLYLEKRSKLGLEKE